MSMIKPKEKAIWMLPGGAMQKPFVDKIKARGYKAIVSDMAADCYCREYADEFVNVDAYDLEGNEKAAAKLSKIYNICAVVTGGSACWEAPAVIAKKLGIHGVDPGIAKIFRYKNLHRPLLIKAGLPQPKFGTAKTFAEAKKLITEFGLPVCFKATNNAGSRGFTAIRKDEDATEKAFEIAKRFGTTGIVIIEELLIPVENEIAEQSLETVWYNGKMYWLNWVDRPFRNDLKLFPEIDDSRYRRNAWATEIGHINPAVHSNEVVDEVKRQVYVCGVTLGLAGQKGGHIMKCDIFITKDGPYIIEPTLRLSGGWDSGASTPVRGGDFIGGAIELALGKKLDLSMWQMYFELKYPQVHSAILTEVVDSLDTSVTRSFALATGLDRISALKNAEVALNKGNFLGYKDKN